MLTLRSVDRREIFEAWIENESKKPLEEYKQNYLLGKDTVEAYINSVKDQKFRVCVKVDSTPRALCCDLTIDGQCVSSYFMGKWNSLRVDKGIAFEDLDGGPGEIIPLRFGQTQVRGITPVPVKDGGSNGR